MRWTSPSGSHDFDPGQQGGGLTDAGCESAYEWVKRAFASILKGKAGYGLKKRAEARGSAAPDWDPVSLRCSIEASSPPLMSGLSMQIKRYALPETYGMRKRVSTEALLELTSSEGRKVGIPPLRSSLRTDLISATQTPVIRQSGGVAIRMPAFSLGGGRWTGSVDWMTPGVIHASIDCTLLDAIVKIDLESSDLSCRFVFKEDGSELAAFGLMRLSDKVATLALAYMIQMRTAMEWIEEQLAED